MRRKRLEVEECPNCFGCGHLCNACEDPVNACRCKLDCEEIRPCEDCGATGKLQPDVAYPQGGKEMARA